MKKKLLIMLCSCAIIVSTVGVHKYYAATNNSDNKIIESPSNQTDIHIPNTYKFDNGNLIFKVGNKVSEDSVQKLYWASKELESQFFEAIGTDSPIIKNNDTLPLTIVIYNNEDDAKINMSLYGQAITNDSTYIQNLNTLSTYLNNNSLSLEETFRIQFVKYLEDKFLIGESFTDMNISWLKDGIAEFFTGSNRKSISLRKSILTGIKNSNFPSSIDEILHSDNKNTLSKYSSTFVRYMYNRHRGLFFDLLNSMKENNIENFNSIINKLSNNKDLNTDYKEYLTGLIDCYDFSKDPKVSDDYMKIYDTKTLDSIKNDVLNVITLSNVNIKKDESQFFNTFTLKGTYTLNCNISAMRNWNLMNLEIINAIHDLEALQWDGYKTTTGYFTNPKIISDNRVQYDIVLHGRI